MINGHRGGTQRHIEYRLSVKPGLELDGGVIRGEFECVKFGPKRENDLGDPFTAHEKCLSSTKGIV
jgi:hypothetical protein